jgi:hypothetical protein
MGRTRANEVAPTSALGTIRRVNHTLGRASPASDVPPWEFAHCVECASTLGMDRSGCAARCRKGVQGRTKRMGAGGAEPVRDGTFVPSITRGRSVDTGGGWVMGVGSNVPTDGRPVCTVCAYRTACRGRGGDRCNDCSGLSCDCASLRPDARVSRVGVVARCPSGCVGRACGGGERRAIGIPTVGTYRCSCGRVRRNCSGGDHSRSVAVGAWTPRLALALNARRRTIHSFFRGSCWPCERRNS